MRPAATLLSIMDTIPAFVVSATVEGKILYINRVAEGIDPETVAGSSIFDYIAAEYLDTARECLHRVVTTGEPASYETTAAGPHAKPARYETLVAPVLSDGEVVSVTLIATDITERRALEAELRQAQKMEAVGQLSGGIAHNFNNLLQTILANIDLAEAGASDEARACLRDARESSIQAAELVRHLLTFAGEQDRGPRRTEPLAEVVRHVVRLCARTFDPRIRVRVTPPQDASPKSQASALVLGDHPELQQALMNICINARDALLDSPVERPRIDIHLETFQPTAAQISAHHAVATVRHVRVRVEDNGPGMDAETMRRCLEPFFTTKGVGRGTGLGLSTTYRIVRDHGGWLDVTSEIGVGTTFDICLPTHTPEEEDTPASQPRPSMAPRTEAGGELLLLVEDDPMVRRAIRRSLRAQGYRVEEAADGQRAVEIFQDKPDDIALVIMDKAMPRQGGHLALRELRAIRRYVRVLCITGQSPTSEDEAFDAVLRKPTSSSDLIETIRRLLDQPAG